MKGRGKSIVMMSKEKWDFSSSSFLFPFFLHETSIMMTFHWKREKKKKRKWKDFFLLVVKILQYDYYKSLPFHSLSLYIFIFIIFLSSKHLIWFSLNSLFHQHCNQNLLTILSAFESLEHLKVIQVWCWKWNLSLYFFNTWKLLRKHLQNMNRNKTKKDWIESKVLKVGNTKKREKIRVTFLLLLYLNVESGHSKVLYNFHYHLDYL